MELQSYEKYEKFSSQENYKHFAETRHVNLEDQKEVEDIKDQEGSQNGKMESPQSMKHFATECGDCKTFGNIHQDGGKFVA